MLHGKKRKIYGATIFGKTDFVLCYNLKNNICRDLKMFTKYLFKQLLNVMQFSHYFGSFWDIYRHLKYLNF